MMKESCSNRPCVWGSLKLQVKQIRTTNVIFHSRIKHIFHKRLRWIWMSRHSNYTCLTFVKGSPGYVACAVFRSSSNHQLFGPVHVSTGKAITTASKLASDVWGLCKKSSNNSPQKRLACLKLMKNVEKTLSVIDGNVFLKFKGTNLSTFHPPIKLDHCFVSDK